MNTNTDKALDELHQAWIDAQYEFVALVKRTVPNASGCDRIMEAYRELQALRNGYLFAKKRAAAERDGNGDAM